MAEAFCLSVWQQPSHPPRNPLFLMLLWFYASKGLFCSIQTGIHGNHSLTLGVLLQLLQAWPGFPMSGRQTWCGQLTCFPLLRVKECGSHYSSLGCKPKASIHISHGSMNLVMFGFTLHRVQWGCLWYYDIMHTVYLPIPIPFHLLDLYVTQMTTQQAKASLQATEAVSTWSRNQIPQYFGCGLPPKDIF